MTLRLAEAQLNSERLEQAEATFVSALKNGADPADVENGLGVVEAKRRNHAAAITHFEQALRVRPRFPEALANLAQAQASSGRFADALASYDRAIAEMPGDLSLVLDKAALLARIGRLGGAIALVEAFLKASPNATEAVEFLRRLRAAQRQAPRSSGTTERSHDR